MIIKQQRDIQPSEITPHGIYLRRREFVATAGALALGVATGLQPRSASAQANASLRNAAKSKFSTS